MPEKKKSTQGNHDESSALGVGDIVEGIAKRVTSVAGTALEIASKSTEYAIGTIQRTPEQMEMMGKAGKSLKDLREVAGLTISEVTQALNLKDEKMLEDVESGKTALSIEIILRLASLYSRNDPLPFIMKYLRTYSPSTWELMKKLGFDKLPLQYEREREFLNIYRSQDNARKLSDEGFNKVLDFTRSAFDMALLFASEQESAVSQKKAPAKKKPAQKKRPTSRKKPPGKK